MIICFFEGTMYLFVYFWAPALKAARALVYGSDSPPPFGLIFSTFMCSMMLGSQLYTIWGAKGKVTVASVVYGLSVILLAASMVFAVTILDIGSSELATLWAFCLFEGCVGYYWPSIGYLRGELVHGGIRGQVYGLLRLPVNVFVFCALILTQDGKMACCPLLEQSKYSANTLHRRTTSQYRVRDVQLSADRGFLHHVQVSKLRAQKVHMHMCVRQWRSKWSTWIVLRFLRRLRSDLEGLAGRRSSAYSKESGLKGWDTKKCGCYNKERAVVLVNYLCTSKFGNFLQ